MPELRKQGIICPGQDLSCELGYADGTVVKVEALMHGTGDMRLVVTMAGRTEVFHIISVPRHFGGRQLYFRCHRSSALASVLWHPPGTGCFASLKYWGNRVAYRSQFLNTVDRVHRSKRKLTVRLIGRRDLDPDDWDLPPKPPGMRWKTYRGYEAKFDHYEDVLERDLDRGIMAAALRLSKYVG